ncbi:hypothetical protein TTHERM_00463720 (macronuclear) [Tetrahymena thermophila SB210]|uniref:Tetratricopeptide repeat protein n=1 Tax=Tetrahymena thermophila (strain SB210) TaxID=312017 RepID=Q23PR1_TETTS|nr:hypothetical protein TTHERM_00463720 [Tetrahymena thermophila SB210]EAR98624.2 hypothetical protein TTHERM_00463720 [Tetrahymena thermophila SB210]|eukprot:XP_001018869.2 hypothetical protein TTHERM_00463720 [Tetrahymena thermophila SB210]
MINKGVESTKSSIQESGIYSTTPASQQAKYQKQQHPFYQANQQYQMNNSNYKLGNSSNNYNSIISTASKASTQQIAGVNLQAKGYLSSIAQQDVNSRNFIHNNRKLVMNSGSQQYSASTQATINTMNGGGYFPTQINTEANGFLSSPLINNDIINNNIPLQYQSNKNSQILRMGENMEYLLGKGYLRDACDSFLDYVYQVQDLHFDQLLSDEFCEGSEELQLKESALLYKLSTKFSSYLLQTSSQSTHSNTIINQENINQAQIDIDNSFVILQFIQKVIQSAQNKHEETLILKWKANYYSNLAVYYIRRHEYMLSINYFNLSLQMLQCLQTILQQKIQQNNPNFNTSQAVDQINGEINGNKQQNFNNQHFTSSDNLEIEEDLQLENQLKQPQQQTSRVTQQSNIYTELHQDLPQNLINEINNQVTQKSIVLNNLAVLYGIMEDLDKAEELLIQSVYSMESEVFQQIRNISTQYLRKDKQFLEKLPVLIYGYIFYEGVRKKKLIRNEQPILQTNDPFQYAPNTFLKNAYSLSKKYFGEDNAFTHKIDFFRKRYSLHNQYSDVLAETFPYEVDFQKLKGAQMYFQQQQSEQIYANYILGQDPAKFNTTFTTNQLFSNGACSSIKKQRTESIQKRYSDIFEDIPEDKNIQQNEEKNQDQRKGRNRSLHSLVQNKQNSSLQNRNLGMPQNLNSFLIQQSIWTNRAKPVRSQHQFRIQTQGIDFNQRTRNSNPRNFMVSPNKESNGGSIDLQQDIRIIQKSLAQIENQLNTIKHSNGSISNIGENQDLSKYKKQSKSQSHQNNTEQSSIQREQKVKTKEEEKLESNQIQDNEINTNDYIVHGGVSKIHQKAFAQSNQTNSVRDDRSNSNGSIKPSQFKKESSKQQEKLQKQNIPDYKEIQKQQPQIQKNQIQEQVKKPNLQTTPKIQEQTKEKIAVPQESVQNKIQSENSSVTFGGSFSQSQALIQSQKQKITQKDEKNFTQYSQKKPIAQNDKDQKPQQILTSNSQKSLINLMSNTSIANNYSEVNIQKKSTVDDRQEAPKIASILQQQQNYQISKITETIVKNLQVDQVFVLKKRIHIKDTGDNYIVKCGVLYNKQEKVYKISISSQIGQSSNAPKVEEIELSILTNLLCFVSFQDVLPSTMNLDSINSLYDVCKYFILPFVGLQSKQPERMYNSIGSQAQQNNFMNDLENKVIMVNPRAHGILSEYYKTMFLDQNVLIQFNYIEGFQFRVVICDKETNKKNIRIDVEYDEGSFNALYTTTDKDEYHAQKLKDFFDCTLESETSQQGVELVHRDIELEGLQSVMKRKQTTLTEEYFTQSVKIQNYNNFFTHFSNIVIEFERIIKTFSTHKSLESLCKDVSSFRVRVYQGLKKSMTIITTDSQNKFYPPTTSLASSSNEKNIGVRCLLFNNFESYGAKGIKLKEKGEYTLSVKEMQKIYGLNYNNLLNEQKLILFTLCSYNFNLRVIEKISDSMQKQQSNVEENSIIRVQTVCGGETTFLIQGLDNYQYPMTFEVFGSKDIFLGVKITLYCPITCEEQGIFLTTNQNSWLFQNEILKKKLHHFAVDSLPLSNYFITHIFKKIAVPVLYSNLYIENTNLSLQRQGSQSPIYYSGASSPFAKYSSDQKYSKNPPKLLGTKGLITDNCTILRLETILDPNNVINHFLPQKSK